MGGDRGVQYNTAKQSTLVICIFYISWKKTISYSIVD